MKKAFLAHLLLFLFAGLLLTPGSVAQTIDSKYGTDSIGCIRNFSFYKSSYDNNNYEDAIPAWNKVLRICPKFSRNTYKHGLIMFKHKIANESDIVNKEGLIDSLFLIYDLKQQEISVLEKRKQKTNILSGALIVVEPICNHHLYIVIIFIISKVMDWLVVIMPSRVS